MPDVQPKATAADGRIRSGLSVPLANERTFLAWVRTGLALLAGAVALASLVHDFGPRPLRISITVFLLVLS